MGIPVALDDFNLDSREANDSPYAYDLRCGEIWLLCRQGRHDDHSGVDGVLVIQLFLPAAEFWADAAFAARQRHAGRVGPFGWLLALTCLATLLVAILDLISCGWIQRDEACSNLFGTGYFQLPALSAVVAAVILGLLRLFRPRRLSGFPRPVALPEDTLQRLGAAGQALSAALARQPASVAHILPFPVNVAVGTTDLKRTEYRDGEYRRVRADCVLLVYRAWEAAAGRLAPAPPGGSDQARRAARIGGLTRRLALNGRADVVVGHDGKQFMLNHGRIQRQADSFAALEGEAWRV